MRIGRHFVTLMDEATTTGGAGGTTTTTTTAAAPWYQGVAGADAETIGYFQNKGLDKMSAAEAAVAASKAHREAEKFVGAPAAQLLRLPKDAADEAGWNTLWGRLGRPQEAKGYDFSAIKFSDGTPLDENFATLMREQAFKLNLPKAQAEAMTSEFAKFLDNADRADATEAQAKLLAEQAALKTNWGANVEANMFVAQRAAAALGVDPATVALLEKQLGYSKVMEMFRQIGTKIGEDKFVSSGQQTGNGIMTKDQAVGRLAELKADKAFVDRYLKGDAAAKREMEALHRMIVAQ